jgi:hypothetical protein
MVLDLDRVTLRTPFPARAGQPPQLLTLLGINADHRLTAVLMLAGLTIDVTELRVPVRVLSSLKRLGSALQAETRLPQQPAHRRGRYPVSLPGQLTGEMPQRLGRPSQRRLRITSLVRLDQGQQRREQPLVPFFSALTASAGPPRPPVRQRTLIVLKLEHPLADRGLADPSQPRNHPHAAVAEQTRLRAEQQPALTLIQMRQ